MSVLLLGGTDLTLAVGDRLQELGIPVGAVVYVGERFSISYAEGFVANARAADVEAWCAEHGVHAHLYENSAGLEGLVSSEAYDLGLAAGWYHMVPSRIRETFRLGCLGVHASLLPELRGGAPLNWALLSGRQETGVTLFELADGVDDGPVYGQRSFSIAGDATIEDLVREAEAATLDLVAEVIPLLLRGEVSPVAQSGAPSYSLQRTPEDGRIDWRQPAAEIGRLVRAVGRPYPGARSMFGGRELIVWSAEPLESPVVFGATGQITLLPGNADPCVVTGDGLLAVREVTDDAGQSVLDELRRAANQRFSASW